METERLKLRPFELNDAKRVQDLAGDYEIAKTTLNIPHPYPGGAAETFITRSHEVAKEGTHYDFAIIRKHDNQLVGAIALGITAKYKRAEIAYWTGRPYWGKGYYEEIEARVRSDEPHKERIRDWYEKLGGREHVYTEYIVEVRNEAIESTVVQ